MCRILVIAILMLCSTSITNLRSAFANENAVLKRLVELGGKAKFDGEHLISIDVSSTKATDDDIVLFSECSKLQSLWVAFTSITGKKFNSLKKLEHFKELMLYRSKYSDEHAAMIAELPHLEVLQMAETSATDKTLEALSGSKSLTFLDFGGNEVSDDGLKQLSKLGSLGTLIISESKFTSAGIDALKIALPKLKIYITMHPTKGAVRIATTDLVIDNRSDCDAEPDTSTIFIHNLDSGETNTFSWPYSIPSKGKRIVNKLHAGSNYTVTFEGKCSKTGKQIVGKKENFKAAKGQEIVEIDYTSVGPTGMSPVGELRQLPMVDANISGHQVSQYNDVIQPDVGDILEFKYSYPSLSAPKKISIAESKPGSLELIGFKTISGPFSAPYKTVVALYVVKKDENTKVKLSVDDNEYVFRVSPFALVSSKAK